MANATYTPTHCPKTGRKFTKAERKAANKAKYAAERAAQAASKPKSKRKAKAQKASPKPTKVSVPAKVQPVGGKAGKRKLMRMTKAQLVDLIAAYEHTLQRMTEAPEPASKRKPKAAPAVKKPRRKSVDGIEQSQARKHTANKVGKAVKTKVVHAITEGEPQPFEPRKEVIVPERKAVKREQMRVTLLPGESPEQGIRRMKIQQAQAEAEAIRIEAEQLTLNFEA